MLTIRKEIIEAIIGHAKRLVPIEACGYLAQLDGVIVKNIELTNIDASPEHFSMDPKEQFAAVKAMRAEKMSLAANYHSHPASPSRPSEEDIKLAFDPGISYVIVSLEGGNEIVNSFKIKNNNVEKEEIKII